MGECAKVPIFKPHGVHWPWEEKLREQRLIYDFSFLTPPLHPPRIVWRQMVLGTWYPTAASSIMTVNEMFVILCMMLSVQKIVFVGS